MTMSRALPVEPLYTFKEALALIPCSESWLRQHACDEDKVAEPVHMLDRNHRRRRLFTAKDIRNFRKARLAKHARNHNRIEPDYE